MGRHQGPSLDPHDKRLAVEVEDHPLDYGDFEGTIPKGEYGGGTVMVWDRGFWMPEGSKSAAEQLRDGELKLVFAGQKLKGSWVLVRMKGDRFGGKRTNWLLIKHRDEWAKDGDADKLLNKDRSAASGRTMGQIARGEGKAPESFMLSKSRTKLAKSDAIWHSSKSAEQASTPPGAAPRAQDGLTAPRRGTRPSAACCMHEHLIARRSHAHCRCTGFPRASPFRGDGDRRGVRAGLRSQPEAPRAGAFPRPDRQHRAGEGLARRSDAHCRWGLQVAAFAKDLDHPRWLYVLPNGDVLVAETNAPPKPEDGKGIKGWVMKLLHEARGCRACRAPTASRCCATPTATASPRRAPCS